jgi:hypothetical protein
LPKYKALTYVNLPPDNLKKPGDPITDAELSKAGQSAEDIKSLVGSKAIGKESDPIDKAHAPVEIEGVEGSYNVVADEFASGGEATK